ncbi:GntR family transcriptional regulator [Pigmentiphaga soli]|uniref:GntR family transcriptional regulator n=1 Tax=Pigmentiphaga soli TaxID=1007095 RepID=A0ABP8HGV7_9BURK
MVQTEKAIAGGSLHDQVRRDLLARIANGDYQPGDMLPTEEALCKHYGVSRITIRRAITDLVSQFVLSRRRGVGTVVRYNGAGKRFFRLSGFFEDISLLEQVVLADEVLPAEGRAAAALKVEPGTKIRRVRFVTRHDKECFTLGDSYLPTEKSSAWGPRIDRATQELHAILADEWIADVLEVEVGRPLLAAHRTYFDQNDRPVRYLYARYHPEHYRFIVDLQPSQGRPVSEKELSTP